MQEPLRANCDLEARETCSARLEAIIDPYAILIRKLKEHSRLDKEDVSEVKALKLAQHEF